jgi:putative transposase
MYDTPKGCLFIRQFCKVPHPSMSRRGNCWDNAPQESFFGHMKDEIDYKNYDTFAELQNVIDNYMDYYNNFRYQWGLKKLTPVQCRNQLLVAYFF